ncbi:MAG: hypothetical protein ACYTEQ_20315 [Planctomycetota bacterium]|jgi:hypothetical protein
METDEVDAGRAGSSSVEGGCRAAGRGQKAAGKKNWNAAILVFVILLTGVVAAHSLLTVNRCRSCGTGCPDGSVAGWLCGDGGADSGCPLEANCSEADTVVPKHKGCPLREDVNKPCAGSRDATTPGCCPGAGFGWGDK